MVNAKSAAQTALKIFDGLEVAGMLTDRGVVVRNLIATGMWGEVGKHVNGISPVIQIAVMKLVQYAQKFDLRDMKFGPDSACTKPRCNGVVRVTANDRGLCTQCWTYADDEPPEPGKVVQIK